MNKLLKYYFSIICLGLYFNTTAQKIRFTALTIDDGLSQSVVKEVYKDQLGYVWIATQDGLNKYNGYQISVFRNNIYDSTTISDNNITAITETNSGVLYIGTQNGGLNIYNPYTTSFARILIDNDSTKLNVKDIAKDTENNLWIIAENDIYYYSIKNNKWKSITKSIPEKARFTCLYFRDDILWIGSNKGIFSYNTVSGNVKHYLEKNETGQPKFSFVVMDIFLDDAGNLWFATTGMGLCKINLTSTAFQYLLFEKELSNFVLDIAQDKESNLWIASVKGLAVLKNNYLQKFTAKDNEYSLLTNRINYVFPDNDGNVWIGTDGGLNIYKKHLFKFEHFYKPSNVRLSKNIRREIPLCASKNLMIL